MSNTLANSKRVHDQRALEPGPMIVRQPTKIHWIDLSTDWPTPDDGGTGALAATWPGKAGMTKRAGVRNSPAKAPLGASSAVGLRSKAADLAATASSNAPGDAVNLRKSPGWSSSWTQQQQQASSSSSTSQPMAVVGMTASAQATSSQPAPAEEDTKTVERRVFGNRLPPSPRSRAKAGPTPTTTANGATDNEQTVPEVTKPPPAHARGLLRRAPSPGWMGNRSDSLLGGTRGNSAANSHTGPGHGYNISLATMDHRASTPGPGDEREENEENEEVAGGDPEWLWRYRLVPPSGHQGMQPNARSMNRDDRDGVPPRHSVGPAKRKPPASNRLGASGARIPSTLSRSQSDSVTSSPAMGSASLNAFLKMSQAHARQQLLERQASGHKDGDKDSPFSQVQRLYTVSRANASSSSGPAPSWSRNARAQSPSLSAVQHRVSSGSNQRPSSAGAATRMWSRHSSLRSSVGGRATGSGWRN
mmetsp:Transcript_46681/g.101376  ORF Transcript_46681/g.101376 Transcript_46681/m.101376 type:complete len:475 (-) Transcript_46681:60-1484(-)